MNARILGAIGGVLLGAGVVRAGTIMPLGNGWYVGNDGRGNTWTSMPLGNGWRVTRDSRGNSVTSYPLGGGWYGTSETPGSRGVRLTPLPGLGDGDEDGEE
jgi:hypothetical protein